ncbi:uncharacterized protein LOC111060074 [Nilaparvata lugens]|uniref:uncharacterized protein LOC111060074 n=1 Tax=Nilaparvata lugens TaxID=108931 RepID=UPI00193C8B1C|nr:uncharacterized protein LOC111060074 [Nilaparvata lugens]
MVFVCRGNMKTVSTGDSMAQLLFVFLFSLLHVDWTLGQTQGHILYGVPSASSQVVFQNDAGVSRSLELLPPKSPILGPLIKTLILSTPSETTFQPGAPKDVPEAPYLYYRPPSPYRSAEPFDRNVPSRHTSDYVLVPYSVPGSISSEPLNAPPGTVVIL